MNTASHNYQPARLVIDYHPEHLPEDPSKLRQNIAWFRHMHAMLANPGLMATDACTYLKTPNGFDRNGGPRHVLGHPTMVECFNIVTRDSEVLAAILVNDEVEASHLSKRLLRPMWSRVRDEVQLIRGVCQHLDLQAEYGLVGVEDAGGAVTIFIRSPVPKVMMRDCSPDADLRHATFAYSLSRKAIL